MMRLIDRRYVAGVSLALMTVAMADGPADAAPIFRAGVLSNTVPLLFPWQPNPVSFVGTDLFLAGGNAGLAAADGDLAASASAGPGLLLGMSAFHAPLGSAIDTQGIQSRSSFKFDDGVVSGGVVGSMTPVSLQLSVNGTLKAGALGTFADAGAGLQINVAIQTASGTQNYTEAIDQYCFAGSCFTEFALGAAPAYLTNFTFDEDTGAFSALFPAIFNAISGSLFSVELDLITSVYGSTYGFADDIVDSVADFSVGFNLPGAAFLTAGGYTTDVPSMGVSMNQWTPPGSTPAAAPSPGAVSLLGLGLIGLFGVSRRSQAVGRHTTSE